NYTVKIERLPKNIISNKDLRDYFEQKFGGDKIFGKPYFFKKKDVQVSQELCYFSELIEQLLNIEAEYRNYNNDYRDEIWLLSKFNNILNPKVRLNNKRVN